MPRNKPKFTALGDFISYESVRRWGAAGAGDFLDGDKLPQSRFSIFYALAFLIFLIFMARLFTLTIVNGSQNRQLADANRIKLVKIEAPRGRIFDRRGKELALSKTIYILNKAGQPTEISKQQADELTRQGLAGEDYAGSMGQIEEKVERIYGLGKASAHVLGYTTAASKEDLQAGVTSFGSVGRAGAEEEYNDFLVGKVGKKLVEVDASQNKVSILGQEEPQPGRSLHLTIDSDLQKFAYNALADAADKVGTKRGAAIVTDPNSGQILALASYPAFDPADIAKSVEDKNKPFFNRAIQGVYPPGSTFKIITALAGLASGKINADTEFEDTGEFEFAGSKFANWYFLEFGKVDGVLKIQKAIARSNDIFFYKVAQAVGLGTLRDIAKKFNFGQRSGIDLPGEAVGLVPDEVWKQSAYKAPWYTGDTMHLGIGQGFILATPMQVNLMTSYMAVGKLMKPMVATKIDGQGQSAVNLEGKVLAQNLVSEANFNLVRAGMHDACKSGGTGVPFFNAPYDVGCKTGTAEKVLGDPHAWFTVFAPYDAPQISVTVLIEDGGQGSVVAGPVARQIVDWWMGHRNK